jgi:hypothetical protein
VLRAGHRLLRPGPVSVTVSAAVLPDGADWTAAVRLRDAARAVILQHCGEPDLVQAGHATFLSPDSAVPRSADQDGGRGHDE